MIIAFHFEKSYKFKTVEDAYKRTLVTPKRIEWCIQTGHSWKQWTFDIV